MKPDREEKARQPSAEPKRKRFRVVKLEERIVPTKGKNTHRWCTGGCPGTYPCPSDDCPW